MDRSWMYDRVNPNRHGLKRKFVSGVRQFVKKAIKQPCFKSEGGIRCPCVKCKCTKLSTASQVKHHLYKHGFKPNYFIWTEHGEVKPNIDIRGNSSSNGYVDNENQFAAMNQMVYDAFDPSMKLADAILACSVGFIAVASAFGPRYGRKFL